MPSVPQKNAAPAKSNGAAQPSKDFKVEVNFAGVAPATGDSNPLPLNKCFKVRTNSVEQGFKKDGSGKITYTFRGEIVLPEEYAGRSFIKTMTDIKNEKAKNFWVTALMSHGVKREALEKGKIAFTPAVCSGKMAYIYTSPNPGQKYPNTEFLLPDIAEKRLASQPSGDDAEVEAPAPAQADTDASSESALFE